MEGYERTQVSKHAHQHRLLAHEERRALCPVGGDIGQHEGLHEGAGRDGSGMGAEVGLDEAGRRVVPV